MPKSGTPLTKLSAKHDLTGLTFGRLTVIERAPNTNHGATRWLCRCRCGTFDVAVRGAGLRNGHTRSCGCIKAELNRTRAAKPDGHSARTRVWHIYRHNCKRRNLDWQLSDQEFDLIIASNCAYCGIEPQRKTTYSDNFKYNGIDRINNMLGYLPHNVAPCCFTCNQAKHNLTQDEWSAWLMRLVAFQSVAA